MIEDLEHSGHWLADEGKVIVPKERDEETIGTTSLWLGNFDNIENYEEIDVEVEKNAIEEVSE